VALWCLTAFAPPQTEEGVVEEPEIHEPEPGVVEIESKKPDWWAPRVRLKARVMTGWKYDTDRQSIDQGNDYDENGEFFLQQARLNVRAELNEYVRATVSADFSDAFGASEAIPFLRSAFANVRFHRLFQLRAGRFKRPMSRLELRSAGKIPFRGRGLTNELIVENMQWGDRALGVMLWGKSKPKLVEWALGVTNADQAPAGGNARRGVDVLARMAVTPVKQVSIGVNGGYKRIEHADLSKADVFAGGADIRIKVAGFYFAAEGLAGQDHRIETDPFAAGITGYARYDFELPDGFVIQPIVFGELVDADLHVRTNEAVRALGGVNLIWREKVRLMPQVQVVRSFDDQVDGVANPFVAGETFWLMLSVEAP
jgi:hypothetical protein